MNKRNLSWKATSLALSAALLLGACATDPDNGTTLPGTDTTLPGLGTTTTLPDLGTTSSTVGS